MHRNLGILLVLAMVIFISQAALAEDIYDAIVSGNADSVKAMLDKNPGLVKQAESKLGLTPLHVAVMCGNKDIVKLLIAKKADVNAQAKSGNTALHFAAALGFDEIIKLLIAAKGDVNKENAHAWTPLQYALAFRHADTANLLMKHKAKIGDEKLVWEDPATKASNFKKTISWEKKKWDVSLTDGKLEISQGKTREVIDNGVNYFAAAGTGAGPVVVYKVGNDIYYYHKDDKGNSRKAVEGKGDVIAISIRGHKNGSYIFVAKPDLTLREFWVDSRGGVEKARISFKFKKGS
ncbi:MAG: ankyrin repeat domain-containing protein [Candidatus Eremiobacteraeota bacterium]|nr:ankyrin repeat domain-containing protein [Candidatus Eremiobacteraeota bacterium]